MGTTPPHGLFVGLTTLDVVHRADRRPGPDEKVTADRQDVAAGGPAANAAVTFAALGGRARLLSALGDGPLGRAAYHDLRSCGVAVHDVAAGQDFPLALSAVLVEEATGRRSVVSPDAGRSPVRVPAAPAEHVGRPDVVLVDGHHPDLAHAALDQLARAGDHPPVVLDAGRWKPQMSELLPRVTHAVLSADFRVPGPDAAPLADQVRAAGPAVVVITHGGHPVEWWDATGHGTSPVPPVHVADTLGAGDVFHGAFAAAIARGMSTPAAVEAATTVAGRRVRRTGPRAWLEELSPWW